MGAFSNPLANEILDHVLRGEVFTPPATPFIALFTSSTGLEAGDPAGCDEVSGGGYGRIAGAFDEAASGGTANTSEVSFSEATGDWGTVTHFAICSAATGGSILFWAELTNPRIILTGDVPRFKTGVLSLTLD